MHKILILLLMGGVSLSSCHILRKDKLILKKLDQKLEVEHSVLQNRLSQQRELLLIDSSHNDYTMLFWPKGRFTFSAANGFEGEAEKVMIKGRQINQKVLTLRDKMQHDSTSIKLNYSSQMESSMVIEKNKLKIVPAWIWLLILPLIYLIYFIYKR